MQKNNSLNLRQIFPNFAAMVKWLSKILLIVISLSFFISATEMEFGECHNTFFDEYDTYVKTEQQTVNHASFLEQANYTFALIGFVFNFYQELQIQPQKAKYSSTDFSNQYSSKLFLRNSVWRI